MELEQFIKIYTEKHVHPINDITNAIDYINTNYMNPIHIDDLSRVNCTCTSTLQRSFLAATGTSPMRYVTKLRMSITTLLLETTNISVFEISIDVGYNSVSSFNRHFLNEYGTTPSQWRRQFRTAPACDNIAKTPQSLQLWRFQSVATDSVVREAGLEPARP